jgi:hypothetical protein
MNVVQHIESKRVRIFFMKNKQKPINLFVSPTLDKETRNSIDRMDGNGEEKPR